MKKRIVHLVVFGLISFFLQAQTVSTFVDEFPGDAELSFDANGNIYVNDSGENGVLNGKSVWKVTPSGSFSLFHDNLPSWLVGSIFDLNGNLLVTGWPPPGTISRITPDGNSSSIISTGINGAGSLEIDELGNIYVAEYLSHAVRKCQPDGSNCIPFSIGNPILNPAGLAYVEATGNLYVSNWTNGKIVKIDSNGNPTEFAQLPIPHAGPIKIYGNIMFVTCPLRHIIYKIDMNNPQNIDVLAGILDNPGNVDGDTSIATFNTPTGIGYNNGIFYVAETFQGTGRLRVIDGVLANESHDRKEFSIRVYPNPAQNILNVRINSQNLNLINVFVFDAHGCKMAIQRPKIQAKHFELDINHLSSGIYFIEISSTISNFSETQTFIKD